MISGAAGWWSRRRRGSGFLMVVLGALCISFSPIYVRLGELDPVPTAFQRMLLALPLFAMWAALDFKQGRRAAFGRRQVIGVCRYLDGQVFRAAADVGK